MLSSFLPNKPQITQVSFFTICIFFGFFGASAIFSCFGCFDLAISSSFLFISSILFSNSSLFFSNFSLSFLFFTFSFLLNQSQIKVSFISQIFDGISNAFLAKFIGENLNKITSEVKKINTKASAVAILQSTHSK
ncbi:MAG: hypothetical protein LBQ59_04090 [Candidatus Peribacteria bacterium]|nr:hypothetical protein [Candidatus Peribacteria bacterium]